MKTTARKFRRLSKAQKARFTEYVKQNRDVPSAMLAEDLNLSKTSIITIKANLTRTLEKLMNL